MNFARLAVLLTAVCLYAAAPIAAQATPVLVTNPSGVLTGVTGVAIGSGIFDVSFAGGSCDSVFASCATTSFTFHNGADATTAAQAVAAAIVSLEPGPSHVPAVNKISGCESDTSSACELYVPYDFASGFITASQIYIGVGFIVVLGPTSNSESGTAAYISYVRFTEEAPTTNDVPEPPILGLLGAAGLALGFTTQRRHRKSTATSIH